MKNRLLTLGTIIIMAAVVFAFTGCLGMPASIAEINYQNWGVFGEAAIIPVRNFESLGLVFSETTYTINSKGQMTGTGTFTYQALLKEAHKLEADAIINVTIDRKVEKVADDKKMIKKETWYGSALAIKYTTPVLPAPDNPDVPFNARRIYQTGNRNFSASE